MEESDSFTLAFLPETHRDALKICGSRSGRDGDKIKEAGLTPRAFGDNQISFEEASLVMACRKIYYQDVDPHHFLAPDIAKHYDNDYHRLYMGEVVAIYQKKS
jgi:flavin reductase (DIM6/NTAB) family NADH-FMN oxidoreductase RutF